MILTTRTKGSPTQLVYQSGPRTTAVTPAADPNTTADGAFIRAETVRTSSTATRPRGATVTLHLSRDEIAQLAMAAGIIDHVPVPPPAYPLPRRDTPPSNTDNTVSLSVAEVSLSDVCRVRKGAYEPREGAYEPHEGAYEPREGAYEPHESHQNRMVAAWAKGELESRSQVSELFRTARIVGITTGQDKDGRSVTSIRIRAFGPAYTVKYGAITFRGLRVVPDNYPVIQVDGVFDAAIHAAPIAEDLLGLVVHQPAPEKENHND